MHHLVGAGGSGGRNVYITRGVSAPPPPAAAAAAAADDGSTAASPPPAPDPYAAPPAPALPADASYAPGAPRVAQAYRAPSGHVLVAGALSAGSGGVSSSGAAAAPPAALPFFHGSGGGAQQQSQHQQQWFLLDSGASGLVVDHGASRRLALPAIGELRVAGVAGRSRARLVRARRLTVGPLSIRDPVLMEMDVAGLVRDLPPPPLIAGDTTATAATAVAAGTPPQQQHPIAGIVGYDLFRRAVVDIPGVPALAASSFVPAAAPAPQDPSLVVGDDGSSHSGFFVGGGGGDSGGNGNDASSLSLPALTLQQKLKRGGFLPVGMRSPEADDEGGQEVEEQQIAVGSERRRGDGGDDDQFEWLPMALVAYLPHVVLTFGVPQNDGAAAVVSPRRGLFMLDTGASGADLMFHARAALELGLVAGGGGGVGAGAAAGAGGAGGPGGASVEAVATPPLAAGGGVSFVRGVGGGGSGGKKGASSSSPDAASSRLRAGTAVLPWLQWGALRLEGPVRALVAAPPSAGAAAGAGLDLSRYASGIACADLLGRADLRLDYRRRRVGLRRPKAARVPPPPPAT
jgi:hypothetical protein